jgi:hypothetical protein
LHGGDHQQSLSVEEATGKFKCHNCGAWGTVTECQKSYSAHNNSMPRKGGWTAPGRATFAPAKLVRHASALPQAAPMTINPAAVERARNAARAFEGSPAQEYARRRGIPDDMARAHGLGYWRGKWGGVDSEWLTFPLRCPVTGRVVSVAGRNLRSDIQSEKARVFGEKGIFGATRPGPIPPDVLWVEGAFEVFACLVSPGLPPARAVWGASGRAEWFDDCQRVTLLFDDDEAGHKAADRMAEELSARRTRRGTGPQVLDIEPGTLRGRYSVKDLGELLQKGVLVRLGLPALPDAPPHTAQSSFQTPDPAPTAKVSGKSIPPVSGQFCDPASYTASALYVPNPISKAEVEAYRAEFGDWLDSLPSEAEIIVLLVKGDKDGQAPLLLDYL